MEAEGKYYGEIIIKFVEYRAFMAENRFCMDTGAFRNLLLR